MTKEPKPLRHEPSLAQTRKDALKAARDLRYPLSIIMALKEAKSEAEIYRIMHKQREKL
jgi:hypothetical protein